MPCIHERVGVLHYNFISVLHHNRWGLYDSLGLLFPVEFDTISCFFQEGYAIVSHSQQFGVLNLRGDTLLPLLYEDLKKFSTPMCDLLMYKERGKWGVKHLNGSLILPCAYAETAEVCEPNSSFSMVVAQNGKKGVIKLSGEEIVPLKYTNVECLETSLTYFSVSNTTKRVYIKQIKGLLCRWIMSQLGGFRMWI